MDRRAFLRSAAGVGAAIATDGISSPAIPQSAAARALRLVPHADLSNFDPIWSNAYIARNAGILVWDTLYGVDAKLQPQRQMVEAEQVSGDGLTWTFRLRPGLKFHDSEPVRAKDAVASISRWAARKPMGQRIKAIEPCTDSEAPADGSAICGGPCRTDHAVGTTESSLGSKWLELLSQTAPGLKRAASYVDRRSAIAETPGVHRLAANTGQLPIVWAWEAQGADAGSRPLALLFALEVAVIGVRPVAAP
jgi:hypothetical protein